MSASLPTVLGMSPPPKPYLEGGQADGLEHVKAEGNSQGVLQNPGPPGGGMAMAQGRGQIALPPPTAEGEGSSHFPLGSLRSPFLPPTHFLSRKSPHGQLGWGVLDIPSAL